jgi:uncharacterized protein (TIGR02466 family)
MDLNIEHWFPTTMWNTYIEDISNEELERFSLECMKKSDGVVRSNKGGWQSGGIPQGENDEFDKLVKKINEAVDIASNTVGLGKLALSNIWINVNGKGGYNATHTHPRAAISGVYYIKAKHGQGGFEFERSDGAEHHLQRIPENVQNTFNVFKWIHPSDTGKLILFPSWLRHSVEQNTIDEYRISISFNYCYAD